MTSGGCRWLVSFGWLVVLWHQSLILSGVPGPESPEGRPAALAGRFLVMGDFHFDPFQGLTRDQFARLAASPLADWPVHLRQQPGPAYGRDAPFALVESSIQDAQDRLPDPDFVLIVGDFLAHDWPAKYDRLAPRTRAEDPVAYQAFTTGVIRLLAQRLRLAFPGSRILPVFGNEDSECGDYQLTPGGAFLTRCAEAWAPLVLPESPDREERRRFDENVAGGGFYDIRLPHLQNHRLIALNTVFFAPQYRNACGDSQATPALDQFRWLEAVLDAAQGAGESVWLLMHLPPGMDSYATWEAGGSARPLWQPEWTSGFLRLLRRHEGRIQVAFAGHTHMDDFRVVQMEGRPVLYTKIVPAVSPVFRNNPGYLQVTYDRRTGQLLDHSTYACAVGDGPMTWRLEYTFSGTYAGFRLEPDSLVRLGNALVQGGDLATTYRRLYSVGGPLTPVSPGALGCALLNTTTEAYAACAGGLEEPK
ncbi:MAG: metallophosphoesterase [Verrucomicrobiae bacterium]|nr:metallophosphoesterase [Verrucomicrobiae bacterium]